MNPDALSEQLKYSRWPTMWCPGCGIGILQRQVAETMKDLDMTYQNTTVISGIGCTGRTAGYFNFDTIHGTHGRAIPIAEGVKAARPEMNVVVFSGDGDLLGIGGNHLIHSARRNTKLTVILNTNEIYGLTGGQMAPTTPVGIKTITSPGGTKDRPFNTQKIIVSNDIHFYARCSVWNLPHLKKTLTQAFAWSGFALVDVQNFCYENNGRRLGFKSPFEMLEYVKKNFKVNSKLEPGQLLQEHELGIVKSEPVPSQE